MNETINQQDVAYLPQQPDALGSVQKQIIPAAPNTFALLHDSLCGYVIKNQTFFRVPVIAWSINENCDPHPILLDGKVPEHAYLLGLCAYQFGDTVKFWNKALMIGTNQMSAVIHSTFEKNYERFQETQTGARAQTKEVTK